MKTSHVLACTGVLSAGLLLAGCASSPAGGGSATATDGWRPLFNGTDTAGWTMFLPDPKADPSKTWSVKDGVLRCEGKPVGYIRTNETFTSFELELDWRFDPARGPGNSGVLLRVQAPDKVWPKSVEAQLQSQSAGDIWNIDAFAMKVDMSRTDGRHTEKAHPTNEKPLGGWNHYRIVLDGGKLELWVNDLLQNTATDVQAVPGTIALQSEGAYIEFRNIRIRPLGGK